MIHLGGKIMFKLSQRQAQEIVDKMMQDIPYNINIMNEHGVIIGSGKQERIGTVHQGAVQALETGKMVEVWTEGKYERQGTNEPIIIDQERIGIIGITGNPDEVRPFCNLVRTTVTLLIEQRNRLESLANESKRRNAFLEQLLQHYGVYSQRLKKEAIPYNIDLLLKTMIVYVKYPEPHTLKNNTILKYPWFQLEEDSCVILLQNEAMITKLVTAIHHDDPDAIITTGRLEASIADSYNQARACMQVILALKPKATFMTYDEVEFLVHLTHLHLSETSNPISRLEDNIELMETLRSFIEHNGSVSLTAEALNIHRNTLQYRLKRIHTITGKDPRKVLELFQLVHALITL
jgi:carbohydrate diacid regulator